MAAIAAIWQIRFQAFVAAVVAAVIAILLAFGVSLSPLRLSPHALQLGVAETDVVIDTGRSPLADTNVPISVVSDLAAQYAMLVNSSNVLDPVGHALGVSSSEIAVKEQVTVDLPLSVTDAQETQVGTQVVGDRHHYSILVRNTHGTTVIQLFTQAPTGRQAIAMGNAAASALSAYANNLATSEGVAKRWRVLVRQLGPARGGVVNRNASLEAAVLLGIGIWVLLIIALVTIRRGRAVMRSAAARRADVGQLQGSER